MCICIKQYSPAVIQHTENRISKCLFMQQLVVFFYICVRTYLSIAVICRQSAELSATALATEFAYSVTFILSLIGLITRWINKSANFFLKSHFHFPLIQLAIIFVKFHFAHFLNSILLYNANVMLSFSCKYGSHFMIYAVNVHLHQIYF